MNPKKLRILFILGIILLIIIFTLALNHGNFKNKKMDNSINDNEQNNYSYSFDEIVDLDNIDTKDRFTNLGSDIPDYGNLNEYYDNTDYFFDDRDLHVQNFDGYEVISEEWKHESFGALVPEPKFRKFN